jgi:hypothetical protein
MTTLRMGEAEVAQPGRTLTECIALARACEERLGYSPIPDEEFAKDVQAGIDELRDPLRNVWDDD